MPELRSIFESSRNNGIIPYALPGASKQYHTDNEYVLPDLNLCRRSHIFILDEGGNRESNRVFEKYQFSIGVVKLTYALELVPERPEQVIIIDPIVEGWEKAVDTVLATDSLRAEIVMDCTHTYDSILEADDFVHSKDYEDTKRWHDEGAVYIGDTSNIDPQNLNAIWNAIVLYAMEKFREILPDVNDKTSYLGIAHVYNAMTLGKHEFPIMTTEQYNRFDRAEKRFEELNNQGLLGASHLALTAPLPTGEFAEYANELLDSIEIARGVIAIWDSVMNGFPYYYSNKHLVRQKVMASDYSHSIDPDTVKLIGEAIGVDVMIDAYLDGTSLDDILA